MRCHEHDCAGTSAPRGTGHDTRFAKTPFAATYNGRISRRPRPGWAHAALVSPPVRPLATAANRTRPHESNRRVSRRPTMSGE
ncbi:hypothetical protein DM992_05380 [Burkholderia sp. JP2-270]|nr:hypothetical protein DM992_05380 [Burkholderia sp. JP2-270]